MTLLTLSFPLRLEISADWLAPLLRRLAGRDAGWPGTPPGRLEDWQLRDLNLTQPSRASPWPGPGHPTHYELP